MEGELRICPVCGKTFLVAGLKIHIITTAKNEVYQCYLGNSKEKKHQDYMEKNVKIDEKPVRRWEL